jgi:uncharacterized repeat protein (TIGR03803 family)
MKHPIAALFAAAVACMLILASPPAKAATEMVVYSFKGGSSDGWAPFAALIDVKGTLYSTTAAGGEYGGGTVFALDPKTGTETVLWSFGSGTDGANLQGSLLDVKGILYGTTTYGGAHGEGTVFSLDTKTGEEKVLYSFCAQQGCADGETPYTGLVYLKGLLYGTTDLGGGGAGTVFSLDPNTGTETVLQSFSCCANGNGAFPKGNLIDEKGTLYGTTFDGGADGPGTVFAVDPKSGKEKVVYSFCGVDCQDGAGPEDNVIDVDGTLYGTTAVGGAGGCRDDGILIGCGSVFSLDPATGAESVLYSFPTDGTGGLYPEGGVVDVKGGLYSTTAGGGENCGGEGGCGTVFSVDATTGAEKVLYSFCRKSGCADGEYPYAGLISVDGMLYGTTSQGGDAACEGGCGTVFAVKP